MASPTYLLTYLLTYLPTYLLTYLPTYLPSCTVIFITNYVNLFCLHILLAKAAVNLIKHSTIIFTTLGNVALTR